MSNYLVQQSKTQELIQTKKISTQLYLIRRKLIEDDDIKYVYFQLTRLQTERLNTKLDNVWPCF